MEWTGLALLLLVALGIIATGLPAAFVLITVASLGASIGVASGTIPPALLWTLPTRLINLFENDLLQALPLYVTMGLLLDRLPIANALYRAGHALLSRSSAAPVASGLLLGALLGPMNGSVGASVLGLSRVISPRLDAEGVPPSRRDAVVAVASTLGVLVPPSLVLILLSDAMLSAHTIAVTQTGRNDRIINTADIFHAALAPAALFVLLCLAVALLTGRAATKPLPRKPLTFREGLLAAVTVIALVTLLGGVALGLFFPVEAAALGAFALFIAGLVTGRLPGTVLNMLLRDAIAMTGALFSLLVAATTFTLVLRLLGTDRLVDAFIAAIPGNDLLVVACVLALIGLCAFVLDAFEIIFVIVPIVIPPLLIRVADARWVAVLLMLTLQSSFLLPPFGYALMMVRGAAKQPAPFRPFVRALLPFLVAQWAVLALVLLAPRLVHLGENATDSVRAPAVPISNDDISRKINSMVAPPLPDEAK